MSSIRIELGGDAEKLLEKLRKLSTMERRGVLNAMAESVRTSTMDRFDTQTDPDGKKWRTSIRASMGGGRTLTQTGTLRNSISTKVTDDGFAVGTNNIRAATHQFGDERTIKPKKGKYLRFEAGGKERFAKSVDIRIPARPFLGINQEDEDEITGMLEEYFKE